MSGTSTETNEIYIRAWYGEWKPANLEKARDFARFMTDGLMKGSLQERLDRVNQRHIRGITFTMEDLYGNRIE